jgi:tetratricopeptide (TPR) repeat protein
MEQKTCREAAASASIDVRSGAAICITIVGAVLPYLPTLSHGFVFDDHYFIEGNPWLEGGKGLAETFSSNAWVFQPNASQNYYRPFVNLAFYVQHWLFGFQPWGFHLTSVAMHAIGAVLVFLIALRVAFPGRLFFALAAALLFAAHPVHVEAVAWASAIGDLAGGAWILLSLLLFAEGKGALARVFSVAAFAIALLHKETAVVLPGILLASELGRPELSFRRCLVPLAPYLAVLAGYLVVRSIVVGPMTDLATSGEDAPSAVLGAGWFLASYVHKLLIPSGLSVYYPRETISSVLDVRFLLGLLAVFAAIVGFWLVRRRAVLALSYGLAVLPLLPVLNPNWVGFAERYLYLSTAGYALLLVKGYEWARRRLGRRGLVGCAMAAMIAVFGLVSSAQATVWRDDVTLWAQVLERYPDDPTPWFNLGCAALKAGENEAAVERLERALELDPEFPDARVNLGTAFLRLGLFEKALWQLEQARAASSAAAFERDNNLGVLYAREARWEEAERRFVAALALRPQTAGVRINLGRVLLARGKVLEALAESQRALEQDPESREAKELIRAIRSRSVGP